MWGNNKVKTEGPRPAVAAVAAPTQVQETNSNKPISASTAEVGMSIEAVRQASTAAAKGIARLGAGLHINGEISGQEDLQVDGSVEGLIQLNDGKLTVGASAKLTADIVAREIVIYGNVKGNLRARDRIEIKKEASVIGDLTAARVMIEDGANLKGAIDIDRKVTKASSSIEAA
jgi:cytoskeletal protein CcmA (bactofilin family)